MNKSQNTKLQLETALQRILDGQPERISAHRKLSVRAVEEEANLGNGSGYYYPDLIEKIKTVKQSRTAFQPGKLPTNDVQRLREARKTETKRKEKYRDQVEELRAIVAQQSAQHHQFSHALRRARKRIEELELELAMAKQHAIRTID